MGERTSSRLPRCALVLLAVTRVTAAYLVLVADSAPAGSVVFDASVRALGSERTYRLDAQRSAAFVHHLLHLDPRTGLLSLRKPLRCDGVLYPNLFTFYVESTSERIRHVDYYSVPVRVLVAGADCRRRGSAASSASSASLPFGMALDAKVSEVRRWASETSASFAIPSTEAEAEAEAEAWRGVCLRRSQLVCSLTAFVPRTVRRECRVQFLQPSDARFAVEGGGGDLVARADVCVREPLWTVSVALAVACGGSGSRVADAEHALRLVFHRQEYSDADVARRVRRELRKQSPFFEQPLYVASVPEEQPPGALVTTLRARDPESSPVTYSMSSLLDSRSAGMFSMDTNSGVVTTLARLDRERLDVHYFRVVAQDDTFPPRTGTTTLQINVLDCNDHAPEFELAEYEASVREGAGAGTTLITLKATDQDDAINAEVEYTIEWARAAGEEGEVGEEGEEATDVFRVEARGGTLVTRAPLDREAVARYTLLVRATDQATPVSDRMSTTARVVVTVLDDNDNYPQFSEKTYTVSVAEDRDVATHPLIAAVTATDADDGANAALRYAIIGGNTQLQFSVDSLTGEVALVKPLDYELVRSYRLVVRAQDGGSPSRSNTTQLLVNVRDVNDNAPRFYTSLFQESVSENVPVGYSIVRVQAYDLDEGANAELTYSLSEGGEGVEGEGESEDEFPLAVDARSGWLYTVRALDRERRSKYQLQVTATDGGTPALSSTSAVVVVVQDVNDNDPVFSPAHYEASVAEDEPPGTPLLTVTATDADEDNRLHYEITGGNTRGRFAVTSQNGRGLVTVAQPLDYKQEQRFELTLRATDAGGRSAAARLLVNVTDANNFAPVFLNAPYTAAVLEDSPVGTTVLVVSATDGDAGLNAHITYSLSSEQAVDLAGSAFLVQSLTGAVTTTRLLDRETISGYLLTVTARDGGSPALADTTDIEVSVLDVNDNAPVFQQPLYSATVPEDALVEMSCDVKSKEHGNRNKYLGNTAGDVFFVRQDSTDSYLKSSPCQIVAGRSTSVTRVSATDTDAGLNGRVQYALAAHELADGAFALDAASGVLRTNKPLDRESVASYDLRVLAVDSGTPAMTSTVVVHVRLEDVNDSPPVFESERLTLYVAENSPVGTTVGELIARDPDEGLNALVHYSIKGGEDAGSFSLVTRGDRAELVSAVELDYESARKRYEVVVRAASPPLWSDVRVELLVMDVNDNAPALRDFSVLVNNYRDCFPVGAIGRVPASDADVTDHLTYRILSGNNAHLVLLNSSSGELTLSPQLNTNVPRLASMEISVSDGVNEVKAVMSLGVRLVTEEMLLNSVTVRLEDMTAERFLSPLLGFFIDGVAAIVPCPKENVYVFSVQDDTDISGNILNVSFSARRPEAELLTAGDSSPYYSPTHLRERVYLHRATLARLATVQVLPFDDNVCVHEPCLNFEECVTVLKFGNASDFIHSDTVLFRPILPVTTFTCRCPLGFTGSREHYMCDTEVDLCYSSPCRHGGTCVRREGGHSCACAAGRRGAACELAAAAAEAAAEAETCAAAACRAPARCVAARGGGVRCAGCALAPADTTPACGLRARSFPRPAYLTFPALRQRHRLHLSLRFATTQNSGLLLYNGRYNGRHDFLALEVVESGAGPGGAAGVRFTWSLGGPAAEVTVAGDVSDGGWHRLELHYYNRTATLLLDECDERLALAAAAAEAAGGRPACANRTRRLLPPRCDDPTQTCHRFLDLTGPLQLGGLPPGAASPPPYPHYRGCIADLRIDHRFIDLNSYVADNGTVAGCSERRDHCASSPCFNGATCRDGWDTFLCDCAEGYTGNDCSEPTGAPWRFSGDGMLSFNPLLRPIQLPWLNAFSLRTLQQDCFLMSIQVGQNSTVVISLKGGLLHYWYEGADVALAPRRLADGAWHRAQVRWRGGELTLSLDYGAEGAAVAAPAAARARSLQGLYVGKILIGGPHASFAADLPYFDGCIQDVRIGTPQGVLSRPTVRDNVRDGCSSRADCQLAVCPTHAVCEARWDATECVCGAGRVGPACSPACDLRPCGARADCAERADTPHGYTCTCRNGTHFTEEGCRPQAGAEECPTGWWGAGACGPCRCDVQRGYHPHCNKTTGQCRCKENHYRAGDACLPCACYAGGALNNSCDTLTGQCYCHSGVVGRTCDTCPNLYAEVSPAAGCQVVYDACPRSFSRGVWWPRTKFGEVAVADCPPGTSGRAERTCDVTQRVPWQEPDLFNCSADAFQQLRTQLVALERGSLSLNTFVGVRLAEELARACASVERGALHGTDLLLTLQLLHHLMRRERDQSGLNLTHSQDKDFLKNIMESANTVVDEAYAGVWTSAAAAAGGAPERLLRDLDEYLAALAANQHDTYTSPFEIVTPHLVLGVDVVTWESLYGSAAGARVELPDTSAFVHAPLERAARPPRRRPAPALSFPKYNNYMSNPSKFDKWTRALVPLDLLGIAPEHAPATGGGLGEEWRAVLAYVQHSRRGLARLLPLRCDGTVTRRWGVELAVASPLLQLAVLVAGHARRTPPAPPGLPYSDGEEAAPHDHAPIIIEPTFKKQEQGAAIENEAGEALPLVAAAARAPAYRSLAVGRLERPVRIQMWLDVDGENFDARSNPQCVHWSTLKGVGAGEWSRAGCHTELPYVWPPRAGEPPLVNCTCNHLSTFAVLVDRIDAELVAAPSLLEEAASYSAFAVALPVLLAVLASLCLLRGAVATVSNSIHKHLVFSVFMAELLYFIALKSRTSLVQNDFACKLMAMSLHYWWVCALAWAAVDAWQLRRLLGELRDVNHGPLAPLYAAAYAAPAVLVSLAAGVHQHQYGNALFCWVSCHEAVVWWVVAPAGALAAAAVVFLAAATRAAFTVRDHVSGFGNLRVVLGVSVTGLPLLCAAWASALLLGSERAAGGPARGTLSSLLSAAVLAHAALLALGYCVLNMRVRDNLKRSVLRCLGRKVPLLDASDALADSTHNVAQVNRSALSYARGAGMGAGGGTRHVGISASSTTSRSTTKTSSSPYSRSDGPLRHTSTSTSNYNSAGEPPTAPASRRAGASRPRGGAGVAAAAKGVAAASDSDSDGSGARSLELASSHSSDDEETSAAARDRAMYLPNITEGGTGTGAAPRWPHLHHGPGGGGEGETRWSRQTASDNEAPGPLPRPDLTADAYACAAPDHHPPLHSYGELGEAADYEVGAEGQRYPTAPPDLYPRHYRHSAIAALLKSDYESKLEQHYADCASDCSDTPHHHDKYHFPYTAEEDHAGSRVESPLERSRLPPPPPAHAHAPLACVGETSEKSTTEDDAETRV